MWRSCLGWQAKGARMVKSQMLLEDHLFLHLKIAAIDNYFLWLKELWYVNVSWLPVVHQAILSLPLLSRTGGENTTKKKKLMS